MMYDIVIIGAGPAGLTAGIYAGRAKLKTIILDLNQSGGTVNSAPLIENYPGLDKISGKDLMEKITKQAKQYTEIKEFCKVEEITWSEDNILEIKTNKENFKSKYVILATGNEYKTLDVEGVKEFTGRGVSYCAVCDGSLFIDKEVIIVGGGNSAATQALYLNKIGVKCSIIHRRDKLRCDSKLQDDLNEKKIKIYWNSQLKKVQGNAIVEKAIIYNKETGKEKTLKVNGIFIAIGHEPNNKLITSLDVECDNKGYVKVDKNMKTTHDAIYACGDITGGIKQITVAASQGATAASNIQELLY